tara:strand:- start:1511 stop:1846 length:336 start_codon:yes stop_codon:yes gene_type:complete
MKKILSGSKKIIEKNEDENKKLVEELNSLFDNLLSQVFEYESSKKLYTLKPLDKKFRYYWFVNVKTKMLENFSANIHVELIDEYDEDNYLCHACGKDIIVKKEILNRRIEH